MVIGTEQLRRLYLNSAFGACALGQFKMAKLAKSIRTLLLLLLWAPVDTLLQPVPWEHFNFVNAQFLLLLIYLLRFRPRERRFHLLLHQMAAGVTANTLHSIRLWWTPSFTAIARWRLPRTF